MVWGKWLFAKCSELLSISATDPAALPLTVCESACALPPPLFLPISICRVLLAHLVLRGDKERREPR